jgi:hypothetical protein
VAVKPKRPEDIEVAVAEVVDYMRIRGDFAPALAAVVDRKITAEAARESDMAATDEELQRAADRFRVKLGLHSAEDTRRWLAANGLTVDALERYLETDILIRKFKSLFQKDAGDLLASAEVNATVRELAYQRWLDGIWE